MCSLAVGSVLVVVVVVVTMIKTYLQSKIRLGSQFHAMLKSSEYRKVSQRIPVLSTIWNSNMIATVVVSLVNKRPGAIRFHC